jgi:hypothetical protein
MSEQALALGRGHAVDLLGSTGHRIEEGSPLSASLQVQKRLAAVRMR